MLITSVVIPLYNCDVLGIAADITDAPSRSVTTSLKSGGSARVGKGI